MSHYKPYPAYRDSGVEWIGRVPEHWPVKPICRVASCNDDSLPENMPPDQVLRYVDISSVNHTDGITDVAEIRFADAPSRARRQAKSGDVVISTVRTYLKAVAAVTDTHADCTYSTGFAVLRPRPSEVEPAFLKWLTLNDLVIQAIEAHSEGLSYPAINATELVKLKAVVPSRTEQSTIAAALDRETARIDALIAKKTRFIELLKEKRQALITHAVTKGLDPTVKMKDSGVEWIGEVPEHWAVSQVKFVASIGNGSTPARDRPDYWEHGTYPWLTSSCVNQERVDAAQEFVTPTAMSECHLPMVRPPAVLVGITGQGRTRGMATTLIIEATINQHIAFLKGDEARIKTPFLRSFIDVAYDWLRLDSEGAGSTKGAITCGQLGTLPVLLPPVAEQQIIITHIADMMKRMDSIASKTERSITLLKERRSALITAAVTGQIDLRGEASAATGTPA